MIQVLYDRGIYLPGADLWLDPQGTRPLAFVSSVCGMQSNHGGHHQRMILTEATARLMRARLGFGGKVQHILRFGEQRDFGPFRATLIPGGEVLGAAQILLEHLGENLLYVGNYKSGRSVEGDVTENIHAETLILETTYGHPHFKFPPIEKTMRRLVTFCQESLAGRKVPVLLGYSLGKAREILAALSEAALPVMVHGSIWPMMRLYEELGEGFPPYGSFEPGSVAGHVLLCPLAAAHSPVMEQIPAKSIALLSGSKVDGYAKSRYHLEEIFPLSDHADYNELLGLVERVKPSRVLTLHGFASEFAQDLRSRGLEACSLTGGNQMELLI